MKLLEGKYVDAINYCAKRTDKEPFVFELRYADADTDFRELDRFLWESRHSTGQRFRNRYTGPAVIDITSWNDRVPNDNLRAFLYYMKDHESEIDCYLMSETEFSARITDCVEGLFDIGRPVRVGKPRDKRDKDNGRVIGFALPERRENEHADDCAACRPRRTAKRL